MNTKNHSRFTATHVTVSRKDHDNILSKNQKFLRYLFINYTRSWSLAGVSFYNLKDKDFVKLFKLLA